MVAIQLRLDLFPGRVTLPDGMSLHPARVYIATDDDGVQRATVYLAQGGQPKIVFASQYLEHVGDRINGLQITTDDGILLAVKSKSCGCGNPLKRFNPWPNRTRELSPL